ncbi:unnamed protein product [Ascophyllum nodosum]
METKPAASQEGRGRRVLDGDGDGDVCKAFIRRDPMIIRDDASFDLEHFSVPNHYRDDISEIMIPFGLLVDRIQKLAKDIRDDHGARTIHLVCVLKGGSAYFHELVAALRKFSEFSNHDVVPFTYDFIKVRSYEGLDSSGSVQIVGEDLLALEGKHVLVVEDIVDTGLTMSSLLPVLEARGTKSLRVTSLLEKRTARSCGYKADYVGFSIPDKFVVGFCLDFNEAFRDMNHICVISAKGIERFKKS